ncbi:hypothetical protein C7M79_13685 [Clostridium botulinum]|uniref:hypothetical protein n=1 Tax=Clostridium botulinum TaxID=1491 RepID=UPI000D209789|nr:hypothetical protein C7M79_13685 [Clostridium botulinum]
MQIVKYLIDNTVLTVGFKEDNFVVYSVIPYDITLTKQQLLQKAYEQVKLTIEYEKTLEEHSFTTEETGEEFIPEQSKLNKLEVNFNKLHGKIIDQYNNVISTNVIFSIEGTNKARIENNKIVEDEVEKDTEYYIIARYKDLEKKQKRIIYCTKIVEEKIDPEKVAIAEAIVDLNNRLQKIEGGN